ncbi:MAG: hypothetical protein ACLSVD_03795 [Eggerthellaceae bacterium]
MSGGVYGWIIDRASWGSGDERRGFAQTGDMAILANRAGAYGGLPGRGGQTLRHVDLTEQHAFYDDRLARVGVRRGHRRRTASTTEGVYVINGKESPSKLIGQMKPETGDRNPDQ